jgi:hypothetical protein
MSARANALPKGVAIGKTLIDSGASWLYLPTGLLSMAGP